MATLTKKTVDAAGTAFDWIDATSAGDSVAYASGLHLLVHNGDSVSHTVTIASEYTAVLGSTSNDNAVTVAAGKIAIIPLSSVYKDSTSKEVAWTYDAVTSVEVLVF